MEKMERLKSVQSPRQAVLKIVSEKTERHFAARLPIRIKLTVNDSPINPAPKPVKGCIASLSIPATKGGLSGLL